MAKKTQITQRLYTLAEAGQYLGRSTYSVRELVWAGEVPVIQHKPRGKMWIDLKDLDRFIDSEKRTVI